MTPEHHPCRQGNTTRAAARNAKAAHAGVQPVSRSASQTPRQPKARTMRRSREDNGGQASTGREPLRAVTFDATGTLFHCPRLAEIYAVVMARHGAAIEPAVVGELIPVVWSELDCRVEHGRDRFASHREGARGFWRDFLARLCTLARLSPPSRFLAAELYDCFARAEAWCLHPDVEETLTRLGEGGLRLAVVSNWDERLPGVLGGLGIGERFDTVVFSQRVGFEKPHPAIFRRALEELGVTAPEALHVGDRPRHDVEGAAAVGMRTALLDRGRQRGEKGALAGLADLVDMLA